MLSDKIGKGIQTFRIKNFNNLFTVVEDLGPDFPNYLNERKVVKLISENKYYALVEVPYKDIVQFIVQLNDNELNVIDWKLIAKSTERLLWRGPKLDDRYIN